MSDTQASTIFKVIVTSSAKTDHQMGRVHRIQMKVNADGHIGTL